MYVARRFAPGIVVQAIVAIALAFGAGFLLRLAGPSAMFIALVVLLTLLFFFALTILRGVLATRAFRRRGGFGPGPRGRPGGGPGGPGREPGGGPRRNPPFLGGTREPRRPFPPRMPPREAAAEIDTTR